MAILLEIFIGELVMGNPVVINLKQQKIAVGLFKSVDETLQGRGSKGDFTDFEDCASKIIVGQFFFGSGAAITLPDKAGNVTSQKCVLDLVVDYAFTDPWILFLEMPLGGVPFYFLQFVARKLMVHYGLSAHSISIANDLKCSRLGVASAEFFIQISPLLQQFRLG